MSTNRTYVLHVITHQYISSRMLATLRPVMVLVAATVLSCGTLLTPQAATTAYPSTASSILARA